jgi:hypothetical protein
MVGCNTLPKSVTGSKLTATANSDVAQALIPDS